MSSLYELDSETSLWICHKTSDKIDECHVTLITGHAEIDGVPLELYRKFSVSTIKDVLIDTLTFCLLLVDSSRFCFKNHGDSQRLVHLREYCNLGHKCTLVVGRGNSAGHCAKTMFNYFRICLGVKCLLVDIDYANNVGTPKYSIGTVSDTGQITSLYYHNSYYTETETYSKLFQKIESFQNSGGTVVINSFECKFQFMYKYLLQMILSIGLNNIYVVNHSPLIGSISSKLPIHTLIFKSPLWYDLPYKNTQLEHVEIISENIIYILKKTHLPPDSCLPFGYKRLLKSRFILCNNIKSDLKNGTLYGVTNEKPDVNSNVFTKILALVRYVSNDNFKLICGNLDKIDKETYLIIYDNESVLCGKI